MQKKITLSLVVIVVALMMATVDASIDLSNVDLAMFKFFKYPNSSHRAQPPQEADVLVKAKAMLTYAADVLFGNSPNSLDIPIAFDPQSGQRWRQHYERHFGQRGVNLVALLGQGYSKEQLVQYGAMTKS